MSTHPFPEFQPQRPPSGSYDHVEGVLLSILLYKDSNKPDIVGEYIKTSASTGY